MNKPPSEPALKAAASILQFLFDKELLAEHEITKSLKRDVAALIDIELSKAP